MSFIFELPEVGEGIVEAEVVQWNVKVGDVVEVDQPLCEITTDKAQLEISSPKSGKILKLYGEPGQIIKVHTPLVEMDTSDTKASAEKPSPAADAPPPAAPKAAAPPPAPPKSAPPPKEVRAPIPPPAPAAPMAAALLPAEHAPSGPMKATPAVRRYARDQQVDIQMIPGSGPGGRVTRQDIDAFRGRTSAPSTPMPAPLADASVPSGTEERIKIIGIRRKIGEQMVRAKQTAPHFTYVEEIDATRLVEVRKHLKPIAESRGTKLTYLSFMMKACSLVFQEFPKVNSVVDEENMEQVVRGDHNIGFATDTENGLLVPVVANVEQKSILHIAQEIQGLVSRARSGTLSRSEMTGGTFTITSVGNIGGVLATPIINVPEVAILGMNTIRQRPMVVDGDIAIRDMMYLSPSFDHRMIDGAVAARFVARLKEVLEHPEHLTKVFV